MNCIRLHGSLWWVLSLRTLPHKPWTEQNLWWTWFISWFMTIPNNESPWFKCPMTADRSSYSPLSPLPVLRPCSQVSIIPASSHCTLITELGFGRWAYFEMDLFCCWKNAANKPHPGPFSFLSLSLHSMGGGLAVPQQVTWIIICQGLYNLQESLWVLVKHVVHNSVRCKGACHWEVKLGNGQAIIHSLLWRHMIWTEGVVQIWRLYRNR